MQDKAPRGYTGVGGVVTLEFEGTTVGEAELNLYYYRTWELEETLRQEDGFEYMSRKGIPIKVVNKRN